MPDLSLPEQRARLEELREYLKELGNYEDFAYHSHFKCILDLALERLERLEREEWENTNQQVNVGADHGRLRRDGAGGGADGMSHPLQSWVDEAVAQAMQSPCVSKRGVVISSEDGRLISAAYNNQPYPFVCTGDERCKSKCGKTAVHAEQAAILRAREPLAGAWMLHAKAKQGKPCASMAPSCLECSKLILASGIAWMHLLHDPQAQMLPGATVEAEVEGFQSTGELGILQVRRYSAVHFHYLTAEWWHRIEPKLASSEVSA